MSTRQLTDLEFMQSPLKWPRMVLPIKRDMSHTPPNYACLTYFALSEELEQAFVIYCNLFDLPQKTMADWTECDVKELVAQGWVVD